MSALIRGGAIVRDDYLTLANDDALPAATKVIVSLERWHAQHAELAGAGGAVGVQLPNTVDVESVWPQIADRPLLVLQFPAFGDGRAYSQARTLRGRLGFRGEIRAVGQAVVHDQLQSMSRVGIDSFQLRDDQDPQACLQALRGFDLAYQPAEDALPVVRRLRTTL